MQKDAEDLKKELFGQYGDTIKFTYLDVLSEEIMNYPSIVKILDKVHLPLVVINDQPRFYGGLNKAMITEVIQQLLKQQ